jgi:hypothetical protein
MRIDAATAAAWRGARHAPAIALEPVKAPGGDGGSGIVPAEERRGGPAVR